MAKNNPDTTSEQLKKSFESVRHSCGASFTSAGAFKAYQLKRMQALLNANSLNVNTAQLYVDTYQDAFLNELVALQGAESSLQKIKASGRNIFVVSDGGTDLQRAILQKLKLEQFVDKLWTSGDEHLSKSEGLFSRVAQKDCLDPKACLVVGDSIERDVIPGNKAGMTTIHYNEKGVCMDGKCPAKTCISTLDDLMHFVDGRFKK